MSKHETSAYKQGKRNKQTGLVGGGGGINIGGIVLWVGALAVASFAAAAFGAHRRRRYSNEKSSPQSKEKEEEASQGLLFVLQKSSSNFHSNPCCKSNGSMTEMVATQIDSYALDSTNCLILEENPDNQKILLTDDYKKDDNKSCDFHSEIEECYFPVIDHPSSSELENRIENGSLMEISQVVNQVETIDAVNLSVEKTALMHSVSVVEEENGKDGDGDEEVVKEVLPLVESIEVEEEEEPVYALKISADKTSSIKEDETVEEFPLKERTQVWKVEGEIEGDSKISADLTSSMHSVKEEDEEEAIEKSPMSERIKIWKEEEAIIGASQITADITLPIDSVEEEEGDKEIVQETLLKEEAMDGASKISADVTSSPHFVEEDDDDEEEEEDINDDNDTDDNEEDEAKEEYLMEKGKEYSEETESSSAGSNAEEIWPEESIEALPLELKKTMLYSATKIVEEDQTTKTEECNNFNDSKTNNLKNCRDGYQTSQTPMFLKKEGTLEYTMVNEQPSILTKWRIWISYILALTLMVLLLFTYRNSLYYSSS